MAASDEALNSLSDERRELLDLWLSQAAPSDKAPYAEPRTWQEQTLARIWSEVLVVERVGIDDDYFALGGDSIVAIVVVAKAHEAGIGLVTSDLFDTPTIRQLAQRVVDPVDPIVPTGSRVEHLLTPLQQGMLYHALQDPVAYVVQVSARLEGDVDVADLAAAWQLVAQRNPALRLSFQWTDGVPRQVVHPSTTIPVEVIDIADADPAGQCAEIRRHLTVDRAHGLPVDQPPLLRVTLLRLGDAAFHCIVTHHHLLLDGWSQQLVLTELLEVYDGLAGGSVLAPRDRMPIGSYLDWLGGKDLASAERFWRRRLAGLRPTRLLNGTTSGAGGYAEVSRRLSGDALDGFCRRHGLTMGTILQAGWALQLSRITGSDDVVFGLTVSGRTPELPGMAEAIGMFINTLPARMAVVRSAEPVLWLVGLQRELAELTGYFHSPLTLVESCRDDRSDRRLFESLVVIENFPSPIDEGYASGRLRVTEATSLVEEGYPLVLEVRPGTPVRLRLRYQTGVIPESVADELLTGVAAFLELVTATTADRVSDLAALVDAQVARAAAAADDRRRIREASRLLAARRQPVRSGGDNDG